MNITEVRTALIPKIKAFCNVPIIQADGNGPTPKGSFATYKFTTAYGKDVGRADETYKDGQLIQQSSYKATISFTAYNMDDDVSRDLAQKIYDWFEFYGQEVLSAANVAVVELSNITNRDAFVVENYERRNGFDVIIRVSRELGRASQDIGYVDTFGNLNF